MRTSLGNEVLTFQMEGTGRFPKGSNMGKKGEDLDVGLRKAINTNYMWWFE